VTPGAAAAVFRLDDDAASHLFVAGHHGWDEGMPRVRTSTTIYDLASLTKVLSTTALAALACSRGVLDLDEAPWEGWPDVTVRHVLLHRSGLCAWQPFFEDAIAHRVVGLAQGRDVVIEAVLGHAPDTAPDTVTVYSDLGFIALGALLETRLGGRLDHLFDTLVAPRFGTASLSYVPLFEQGYHPRYVDVAPTELCAWRGRALQGQVHDDNAFAMGGIAGHAGLFGSVLDVMRAARCLLGDIVSPRDAWGETIAQLAREGDERALGFDRATPGGSTGGALSADAVGHLGFTGTSLWLDPSHPGGPAAFVLLTNRVHKRRDGEGIKALRQDFHHLAAELLRSSTA